MFKLNRKTAAPSTKLEDRSMSASTIAAAALSAFEFAAADLEFAADEQDEVAREAQDEMDYFEMVVSAAEGEAENHRHVARKIRSLIN